MLSRSPRAQVLALLAAATAAASAPACTTTETTETLDDSSSSSALIVRPADFPGNPPCSDAPGAMRSYVATLIDQVNPSVPFTLPSSLPTPCSQGVRFDDVVAGHPYTVEIDGYEAFADELGPSGWAKPNGDIDYKVLRSGDRHMEAKDGTDLTPRWLASCGKDPSPHIVPANTGTLLVAQKCTPFEDTAPGSTETAVEISPQDSLGTLACAGSAPEGQPSVASFDLLPQDGLPGLLGLPCTSPAFVQKYTGKPLAPGKQLTFFIDAHPAADAPVAWGASCTAKVEEGLTVRAACTPLSAEGSFHIDISSLLAGFGAECSGDLATYDTKLVSGGLSAQKLGLPCTTDLSLGPLTPGDYAATVSVRDTDGGVVFAFACTATVEPGRPAEATCNLQ